MIIRFGYVFNALGLLDASPSNTLTFARYSALSKSEQIDKLKVITAQNLQHTKRILRYNIAHEIDLYRFSSSLFPLATHLAYVKNWIFLLFSIIIIILLTIEMLNGKFIGTESSKRGSILLFL